MIIHCVLSLVSLLQTGCAKDVQECGGEPEFVYREKWGARAATRVRSMHIPVSQVVIGHTVTPMCYTKAQCSRSMRFIQDHHMDDNGWWDIGYSFMIGGDGRVYMGHGWKETGAFAINYNTNSIGVAFLGNFMNDIPTNSSIRAVLDLIKCGIKKGHLTPVVEVYGQRDVTCTLSPGDNLYNIIRKWKWYRGGQMKDYNCD